LHHDNAPSHTSFFTTGFFTKNNMTIALYFPLYPRLKTEKKGGRFDTIWVIEAESQAALNAYEIAQKSPRDRRVGQACYIPSSERFRFL
jgi:hypothetical protein